MPTNVPKLVVLDTKGLSGQELDNVSRTNRFMQEVVSYWNQSPVYLELQVASAPSDSAPLKVLNPFPSEPSAVYVSKGGSGLVWTMIGGNYFQVSSISGLVPGTVRLQVWP